MGSLFSLLLLLWLFLVLVSVVCILSFYFYLVHLIPLSQGLKLTVSMHCVWFGLFVLGIMYLVLVILLLPLGPLGYAGLFTALLALLFLYEVMGSSSPVSIKLGYWLEHLNVEWSFLFDSLTVSMIIPVILVSALVQLYSMGYMAGDSYLPRFLSYLSLFSLMMLFLVTGENLLVLFLGWEGVGIASYLLINFWFTRLHANFAALKAFLMNRVGDYSLVLGILLLFRVYSDLSIDSLLSLALYLNGDLLFVIIIFVIIGASAKSAQLGLHGWLPTAMEGPTPVSALIHAATMVTAGVYLLMRLSPLLEWTTIGLVVIVWLGGLSALFGAISGLLEYDLKKVIAYSTTSQLGYMVLACGLSQYSLALFHLINHAFFKALLFLSAGLVIHALIDQQDLREMGGLVLFNPETYSLVLLGSLSLMAFPFLTGFYSKDLILEIAIIPRNATILIAFILVLVAAYLTASYSARLLIGCFLSTPHIHHTLFADTLYSYSMLVTVLLSLGACWFGYLVNELFLFSSYQGALFVQPDNLYLLDALPYSVGFPLLTLLTLFVLLPLSVSRSRLGDRVGVVSFLNHFNLLNHLIIHNIMLFALYLSRYWDRGLLELIGPTGLLKLFHYYSFKLELLTSRLPKQ